MEMRLLVLETLEQDGFVVEAVPDGGRLLVEVSHQIARRLEGVDLIVSDVRMPVVSGFQIIEALRAAHCWTPVILMTAFGDDAARAHAEKLGALLLDKPFRLDELRLAARTLLGLEARGKG